MALYGKGEIGVHMGLRLLNQLTLKWGISLDGPGGPNVITWALNSERRRQKKEKQKDGSMSTQPDFAGFEDGEGT